MAKNTVDQTYSTGIARVMSSENLQVTFSDKIAAATFDIKNRLLTLPNYDHDDKDVSDLFISGQISHAINNDRLAYREFESEYLVKNDKGEKILDPRMKVIYDTVADARAEKLIKRKFPGLKPIYGRAYDKLSEKDWFGINDIPEDNLYETLSLVDRLNLYYKAGHHYKVPFDWSEKPVVDAIEQMETYDDVLKIAKMLYEDIEQDGGGGGGEGDGGGEGEGEGEGKGKGKGKKSEQDGQGDSQSGDDDSSDADSESFKNELKDKDDEKDDDKGDGKDEKGDEDESDDGDDDNGESDAQEQENDRNARMFSNQVTTGKTKQAQMGVTQNTFQNKSSRAIKPAGTVTNYHADFTAPIWKDNFVPFTKFNQGFGDLPNYVDRSVLAKPIVNYLFKQFETKRRAHEYAKILPSKKGGLDPDKMYRHAFDDEIFLKKTLIQNSKNHGLVVLIDFSGSMSNVISQTIMMCLDVMSFCYKANIRFSILGFTDSHVVANGVTVTPEGNTKGNQQSTNYFKNGGYKLVELFSSTMTRKQLISAANWLSTMNSNHASRSKNSIALGGTPFNDALVQMPSYINEFKRANNIEIINFATISDGDSNALGMTSPGRGNTYDRYSTNSHFGGQSLVMTDIGTKKSFTRTNCLSYSASELLLRMIKEVAGVKTSCFYLLDGKHTTQSLVSTGKQVISQRDNSRKFEPIPGTSAFKNAMGYDLISFIDTNSISDANLKNIEKNLKLFVEVIS